MARTTVASLAAVVAEQGTAIEGLAAGQAEILALLKGRVDVAAPAKAGKKAKKAKAPKEFGATKSGKTFRAARLERAAANPLGGLTSVQRKALAATLPKGYDRAAWEKAVKAFKKANKI